MQQTGDWVSIFGVRGITFHAQDARTCRCLGEVWRQRSEAASPYEATKTD